MIHKVTEADRREFERGFVAYLNAEGEAVESIAEWLDLERRRQNARVGIAIGFIVSLIALAVALS